MSDEFDGDSRLFPTLDVVSAATGVAVNPDDVMGFHGVLAYVLGDPSLMTHQLPAALGAARGHLLAQHPWLAEVSPPVGDLPALAVWCDDVVAVRGESLPLTPAVDPAWARGMAVSDLVDRLGPDRVLTLVAVTGEE